MTQQVEPPSAVLAFHLGAELSPSCSTSDLQDVSLPDCSIDRGSGLMVVVLCVKAGLDLVSWEGGVRLVGALQFMGIRAKGRVWVPCPSSFSLAHRVTPLPPRILGYQTHGPVILHCEPLNPSASQSFLSHRPDRMSHSRLSSYL